MTVTATDRAGNATAQPFTVINDSVAPTVQVTVPLTVPVRFTVAWSGSDSGAGLRDYDVQYRDAVTTTWTPWLTSTTGTEAEFTGAPGGSYYFRVRATDNVSNESDWVEAGPVDINAVTKNYFSGGQLVATRRGDALYYIHGDHLGSTSLTTDQSGTLVAEARYLPFGEERWSTGAAVTDFGFTGQRREGFGLLDYRARFYDPLLGWFVSADSIVPDPTNPQALNRFAYGYNNPVKYRDPSGHTVACGATTGSGCEGGWPGYSGYNAAMAERAVATSGQVVIYGGAAILTALGADFVADAGETVGYAATGQWGQAAVSGAATAAPWVPGRFVRSIPGVNWLGSKIDEGLQSVKLYHGTSSVYEASIRAGINPPSGGRNFGGNQLGDGFYTATSQEAAAYFARQAVNRRIAEGLPGGEPIIMEIEVDILQMTGVGVPRYLWWETPQVLINDFDYLEAPVSGLEHWYQLKFNPSSYNKLRVLP